MRNAHGRLSRVAQHTMSGVKERIDDLRRRKAQAEAGGGQKRIAAPVSYTHLTLPTILLV